MEALTVSRLLSAGLSTGSPRFAMLGCFHRGDPLLDLGGWSPETTELLSDMMSDVDLGEPREIDNITDLTRDGVIIQCGASGKIIGNPVGLWVQDASGKYYSVVSDSTGMIMQPLEPSE